MGHVLRRSSGESFVSGKRRRILRQRRILASINLGLFRSFSREWHSRNLSRTRQRNVGFAAPSKIKEIREMSCDAPK
jgi:hypothetical protein